MISFLATLFCFFAAVQASPLSLVSRAALDVFVPTIIQPNSDTVWMIGEAATVTWDASSAPQNISNGASILLGPCDKPLNEWQVIADGFDLRSGQESVTVPDVDAGNNYCIILFGDSGNRSKRFTIQS